MSLFDQQPFGPVPARRPVLQPPDPELEEAVDDPMLVEVELVSPVPVELAGAARGTGSRPVARQPFRSVLTWLLLLGMAGEIVWAIVALVPRALDGGIPETVALALLAVMAVALPVLWRRNASDRRRKG